MLEYDPWSHAALQEALALYERKELSVLDVELGEACNYRCVYCDSPDRKAISRPKHDIVRNLVRTMPVGWVFVCGLGEPMAGSNQGELLGILASCASARIRCSLFTNASLLSDQVTDYVKAGTLSVLFKLDSLRPASIRYLYGTDDPETQLHRIRDLLKCARVQNGLANVAASIVTTRVNIDELETLLQFCDDNGVFPLVADLEDSGKALSMRDELKLSREQLTAIRCRLHVRYGQDYTVPVCPSVIAGIHVSHDNWLVVDEATGLSCHWFWLKEPKIRRLLQVDGGSRYADMKEAVWTYRDRMLSETERLLAESPWLPIGGCGGDIKKMLSLYLMSHCRASNQG